MISITFKANEKTRKYAQENKQNMNTSEVHMWTILKWSCYNFRRQKTLGNFIVDFASLKQKIIIEIDGISHEQKKEYDTMRDIWIVNHGYKILRFIGYIPIPDTMIYEFVWQHIYALEKWESAILEITTE